MSALASTAVNHTRSNDTFDLAAYTPTFCLSGYSARGATRGARRLCRSGLAPQHPLGLREGRLVDLVELDHRLRSE